ncbi:hypothetical protein GCM10009596_18950 [Arthrobacter rhombi]
MTLSIGLFVGALDAAFFVGVGFFVTEAGLTKYLEATQPVFFPADTLDQLPRVEETLTLVPFFSVVTKREDVDALVRRLRFADVCFAVEATAMSAAGPPTEPAASATAKATAATIRRAGWSSFINSVSNRGPPPGGATSSALAACLRGTVDQSGYHFGPRASGCYCRPPSGNR